MSDPSPDSPAVTASTAPSDPSPPPPPPVDDSIIDSLIASEPYHSPFPDYLRRCRNRSVHITHRQDSISWILNANAHCRFQPLTAFLSVNYFDRFLSSSSLPGNNGWAYQLLSVACLSLAAKMEEPDVPLLLDLQVSDPRFVFEPKTVQRMELWVMSILNWRLRSVTPFDFLLHFILKLPVASHTINGDSLAHIQSKCSDLILNTTHVIDFLAFRPSVIAAAAAISAAGGGVDLPESYFEKVNEEMVRSCHQLMEEYLVDTCPSADQKLWRAEQSPPEPPPSSPDGVLDAAVCVSCDTRSDNPLLVLAPSSGDQDIQAEPPVKRLRSCVQDEKP